MTDADLVREFQRGNAGVLNELVDRHHERLVARLAGVCGDWAAAENAAQDTWMKVLVNLPRFDPTGSFSGWLYRIGYHQAIHTWRHDRRQRPAGPDEDDAATEPAGAAPEPIEELISAENVGAVGRAVTALPDHLRIVTVLHYIEGYTVQETAAMLELPPGTVYRRLFDARNRLAAALGRS